jgi:hypothetical protein
MKKIVFVTEMETDPGNCRNCVFIGTKFDCWQKTMHWGFDGRKGPCPCPLMELDVDAGLLIRNLGFPVGTVVFDAKPSHIPEAMANAYTRRNHAGLVRDLKRKTEKKPRKKKALPKLYWDDIPHHIGERPGDR